MFNDYLEIQFIVYTFETIIKIYNMEKVALLGTTFSINGKVHDLIIGVYDLSVLSSEKIIDIKKKSIEKYKFWHGISSKVDWFS